MLPRAALRVTRLPTSILSQHVHLQYRAPASIRLLPIRTYASKPDRSRRAPPPPAATRPARLSQPPPPKAAAPVPTRQTSPGTSIPKDQTWKPADGIKLGGPATAAATGASGNVSAASAKTPIDGTRPTVETSKKDSPIVQDSTPQEPLAQKLDADEPVPGTIRDAAHKAQAAAENTPPPPEAPVEQEPTTEQSQQPLPDLRQGLPSTFDLEFGTGKKGGAERSRSERPSEQYDVVDLTTTPPEARERGDREEREYDRRAYETSLDRRRAQLANYLYVAIAFSLATGAFYLARPFSAREDVPAGIEPEDTQGWNPSKMYQRIRARLGNQVGYYTEPTFPKLLPEVPETQRAPFTLVLSLEDLMIHSTWDRQNGYRTAKRPGIDYFVRYLSQYYELVLFTSVPLAMADPVIKKLDPYHFIMWPLGREATKYEGGEYIKDLSYLNRDLKKTLIIDTHAPHVRNQPENAVILPKWSGDPKDPHTKDLVALIPFLEYVATMGVDDVRTVLKSFEGQDIATEFARRESEARRKFNEQLETERSKRPKRSLGALGGALGIKSSPAMGGGMVLADGQSVAEGLAQGKMMSDLIREQGQKQYEHLEKQIREHGADWLREEEEEQKKAVEAQMRDMKKGWFGGSSSAPPPKAA